MKKSVKVRRHVRGDGSVVESHTREITRNERESLSEAMRRKKREREQANLLQEYLEEN